MIRTIVAICFVAGNLAASSSDEWRVRAAQAVRLQSAGRLVEAEREARAALELTREGPGGSTRNYIVVLSRVLSGILLDQDLFVEAEEVGRSALTLAERRPDDIAV